MGAIVTGLYDVVAVVSVQSILRDQDLGGGAAGIVEEVGGGGIGPEVCGNNSVVCVANLVAEDKADTAGCRLAELAASSQGEGLGRVGGCKSDGLVKVVASEAT